MLLPRQLGSDEMIARFRGEARTIASLDHPAILPVYNADLYRGIPFFTMQLAGGGTLAQRRSAYLRQWREIAALIATVADAVQFAHSRGVIHRDLKPGNILFSDDGRAFVSDFGLAKFAGAETATEPLASVLGTPAYLAPEVVRHGAHAATTAADIYGLGAVLYELLAQTPPFSADSFEGLLKAVTDSPPKAPHLIIPGVPGDLEIICLRCLAKDPVLRFVSASELAAELRRWLEGRPILSNPVSSAERLWRWCRRRPALAALTLALMLVVTGGGMAQWLTNRSLKRALVATHLAEADARQKLHASLLAEARLQSRSRQPGQRDKTLEILARAAQIAPTVEVRSETASALTRADLRLVRELPGTFLDNITNTDFSPELDAYLLPLREGGFARQSSTDGQVLAKYSAPGGAVPRFLRFSRDGRIMSAILPDLKTGFWWTDRDAPAWLALPENGGVTPTAMHPSRPLVAYRRGDAELRVHDLLTGNEETLARDGARIFALAFDPAGARLAVLRRDAVELRDAATAAVIWSLSETPLGMAPAWSDDGFWFATGSAARNDISIREAGSGLIVQTLSGHTTYPGIVKFLPGGKQVVSIAYDRTLRLWEVATGKELWTLRGHRAWVRSVAISADGQRAISGGHDATLRCWDLARRAPLRTIGGAQGWAVTVATSRDGRRAATPSFAGAAHVWDLEGDRLVRAFQHPELVSGVDLSADGRRLVTSGHDGRVRLFAVDEGRELASFEGHAGQATAVALPPAAIMASAICGFMPSMASSVWREAVSGFTRAPKPKIVAWRSSAGTSRCGMFGIDLSPLIECSLAARASLPTGSPMALAAACARLTASNASTPRRLASDRMSDWICDDGDCLMSILPRSSSIATVIAPPSISNVTALPSRGIVRSAAARLISWMPIWMPARASSRARTRSAALRRAVASLRALVTTVAAVRARNSETQTVVTSAIPRWRGAKPSWRGALPPSREPRPFPPARVFHIGLIGRSTPRQPASRSRGPRRSADLFRLVVTPLGADLGRH